MVGIVQLISMLHSITIIYYVRLSFIPQTRTQPANSMRRDKRSPHSLYDGTHDDGVEQVKLAPHAAATGTGFAGGSGRRRQQVALY